MIALGQKVVECRTEEPQRLFLKTLPQIERHLRRGFRQLQGEALEDAMAEATANCYVAVVRLCRRGERHKAFPSSLARYAIRQFFAGRQVGGRLNGRDPLSRYAQQQNGIQVERLDRFDSHVGGWLASLVEDRRATIPDQVAMRIDVPAWMAGLRRAQRRIARDLAMGFSTSEVARMHKLSAGRISQLRKELLQSWNAFHGTVDEHAVSSCNQKELPNGGSCRRRCCYPVCVLGAEAQ